MLDRSDSPDSLAVRAARSGGYISLVREPTSPPRSARAVRAVRSGGVLERGGSPLVLPGLPGLSGLLESPDSPDSPRVVRAVRAVRSGGCI